MRRSWIAVLALVVALGLAAPTLMADKGKAKEKGIGHGKIESDKHDHDKIKDADRGWERREGHEYRIYGASEGPPPGWSHGKKTGWRDCGLPPGQAKKYGCRTYIYGGRRYYYYRDEQDRIIVRRPIIHVHGSVDIVR